MKVSKKAETNVNLHIKKGPDGAHYITKLCAESGDVLAANNFQYEPDVSIFTRLEDCAGKNLTRSPFSKNFSSK